MHLQRGDVVGACERKLDQRSSQELLPYALDQVLDEGMDMVGRSPDSNPECKSDYAS